MILGLVRGVDGLPEHRVRAGRVSGVRVLAVFRWGFGGHASSSWRACVSVTYVGGVVAGDQSVTSCSPSTDPGGTRARSDVEGVGAVRSGVGLLLTRGRWGARPWGRLLYFPRKYPEIEENAWLSE